MAGIQIREAGLEDCEVICGIHASSIRILGRSHYSKEDVEAWAGRWEPADYEHIVTDNEVLLACRGDRVLGFGTLDLDKAEIRQLYVHPDHPRQGIGTKLLNEMLSRARTAGLDSLHLESSLHALDFYLQAGFVEGERCKHRFRRGGAIDCISMTMDLRQ